MARGKKYQPEQVVNLLPQIEVPVAKGKSTGVTNLESKILRSAQAPTL